MKQPWPTATQSQSPVRTQKYQEQTILRTYLLSDSTVQSLKDLGHLTYVRFLNLSRHLLGLLGRGISLVAGQE